MSGHSWLTPPSVVHPMAVLSFTGASISRLAKPNIVRDESRVTDRCPRALGLSVRESGAASLLQTPGLPSTRRFGRNFREPRRRRRRLAGSLCALSRMVIRTASWSRCVAVSRARRGSGRRINVNSTADSFPPSGVEKEEARRRERFER